MSEEDKNQFLEGFEAQKILRPSVAYLQAYKSYPVRISELVFGSLLASYILGFVSVGVARLNPTSEEWSKLVCDALVYLTICCSFSFLTAALYSVYHNSILTMPNVPISDLTNDFTIAISQAVSFGISIVWPSSFLICLGLSLLLVFARQDKKFKALAEFFYQKLKPEDEASSQSDESNLRDQQKSKPTKIHAMFREKLKETNLANGWGPVEPGHNKIAITLIGIGIFIVLFALVSDGMLTSTPPMWIKYFDIKILCAIIYSLIGLIFIQNTRKILKKNSVALDDYGKAVVEKMDKAAVELAKSIKNT